jgi:hypothetical protein
MMMIWFICFHQNHDNQSLVVQHNTVELLQGILRKWLIASEIQPTPSVFKF